MHVRAAVASIWEVAMQSAPVSDSLEGPKQRDATGDAIFGDRFFPSICPAPPFSTLDAGGSENFFFGNRLDTAPHRSTLSLEAQACQIRAVLARLRRERPLALCTTYAT